MRSRGCRWARSHQEEVKKRKRARATRKSIPLRARRPRRCGTIVRRKRSRRRGRGEEERSLGVDRYSERIKREAIRECLMPRTKLCNYLYVRLRPSWLARVRALACTYDAICRCDMWWYVVHLHTTIREYVCVYVCEKACDRACECGNTYARPSTYAYTEGTHHGSHLSPKAHERHIS